MTNDLGNDYRPLLPGVRNEAIDHALREQLRYLRDRAPEAVARHIDEVLTGQRTLRGMAESDDVNAFLEPLVRRGLTLLEQLSPAELAERARESRARVGDPTLRHGGRAQSA